jgi:hypothetical protein
MYFAFTMFHSLLTAVAASLLAARGIVLVIMKLRHVLRGYDYTITLSIIVKCIVERPCHSLQRCR